MLCYNHQLQVFWNHQSCVVVINSNPATPKCLVHLLHMYHIAKHCWNPCCQSSYKICQSGPTSHSHDPTNQIPFLNLLVCCSVRDIESAKFLVLLLPTCLFLDKEISQTIVDAMTSFIRKNGSWVEIWADECMMMYPDFEYDIPPACGLKLTKLTEGGIMMTNTCNAAHGVNRLLIDKPKLDY